MHRVVESPCTNCHAKLNATSSSSEEDSPNPGDITICLYCGHIMAYSDDMKLRDLTDEEVIEVAGHPDLIKNQKFVEFSNKLRGKHA